MQVLIGILILAASFNASGVNAQEIRVPVRWCHLIESPTFLKDIPTDIGAERSLFLRTSRTNDIWGPQAGITFFPAASFSHGLFTGVPIHDPKLPDGTNALERPGDMRIDETEALQAAINCEQAWQDLQDRFDIRLPGLIAVNIRWSLSPAIGVLWHKFACGVLWAPYCADPTLLGVNDGAHLLVVDEECYSQSPPTYQCHQPSLQQFANEVVLPHELGHHLWLGHGNGIDDDGDGLLDSCCDLGEAPSGQNLMNETANGGFTTITEAQAAQARRFALMTPGARIVRPNGEIASSIIGDQRIDTVGEASERGLDLVSFGLARDTDTRLLTVFHRMLDILPGGEHRFAGFFDLDGNPQTGGTPSQLGFTTEFAGAELVTLVSLVPRGEFNRDIIGRVWRSNGSELLEITPHPSIVAQVLTYTETETHKPGFDRVVISMPEDALTPIGPRVRVQAFTQNLDSRLLPPDVLPDEGGGAAAVLRMTPPHITECAASSNTARLGETLTVRAIGLLQNTNTSVSFDRTHITNVMTNALGNVEVPIRVPVDVTPGFHTVNLMTTDTEGQGLGAMCRLAVGNSRHVVVDIKPNGFPNSVNPRSKEVIPVAILTTEDFDATTVNPNSVQFGPNHSLEAHGRGHITDVDKDGDKDLVLHFEMPSSGIKCGDTSAALTGFTYDGKPVEGSDTIVTRACN